MSPLLGNYGDDASSFVPQLGLHVCIPTENLSGWTVASSTHVCSWQVSVAPSSRQVQLSGNCLLHRQVASYWTALWWEKESFQEQYRLPVIWESKQILQFMNMKQGHDMELTEWYFQTSRTLRSKFQEHIRYIKNNDPRWA